MAKLRVKPLQPGGKFVIINSALIFVQDSPALRVQDSYKFELGTTL